MPKAKDNGDNLSIRCPTCRQRFSVGGNLMNRMVECGACDARFRINDDVILRSKKFYPGERPATELNNYHRVPLPAAAPEGLATMRYAEFSNPERLEPASPQRILAGIFGVSLMALIALMLIFAVDPGRAFSVVPLASKLVVAGFSSLLGVGLLIYANPKARLKAAFIGSLLAAGLMTLPFFFKGQSIKSNTTNGSTSSPVQVVPIPEEPNTVATLRDRFVTKPLEVEQERMAKSGSGKHAYGIYLINLLPRHKFTARDFLIRETEAEPSSHPFPRDNGDYLMVLTDIGTDIEDVAEIAGRLGVTEEVHSEISVVVVRVDNDLFLSGSADKLNNKKDPAFYELNQRELRSIDIDRVKRAVERLAEAEPAIYRTDISRTLMELLGKPGIDFQDVIARALLVWAEDLEPAAQAGLKVLQKSFAAGQPVSESLVALVVRGKSEDAIPTLNALWLQNPVVWERYYVKFGAPIAPGLLGQLSSESAPVRHSAIKLLGDIGTGAVIPDLEKLLNDKDAEVRVLAERSIVRIKQR